MKKRIIPVLLALALCAGYAPARAYSIPDFTDLPASHWAYAPVMAMAEAKVFSGVGDGKFDPTGQVSAAMLVTLLGRVAFPEVTVKAGETWYGPYLEAAEGAGWLDGTQISTVAPNTAVTRYDMAVVLAQAGGQMGMGTAPADISQLPDYASIPFQYRYAVSLVYGQGLITGDGEGNFGGGRTMSRAEMAVVMQRLINKTQGSGAQDSYSYTSPITGTTLTAKPGSGTSHTVVDPAYSLNGTQLLLPNAQAWSGGIVSNESHGALNDKGLQSFSWSLAKDGEDILALAKAYVDLLVSDYDMTVADTSSYSGGIIKETDKWYYLTYNGKAAVTKDRVEWTSLLEKRTADVVVFVMEKRGDSFLMVSCPAEMAAAPAADGLLTYDDSDTLEYSSGSSGTKDAFYLNRWGADKDNYIYVSFAQDTWEEGTVYDRDQLLEEGSLSKSRVYVSLTSADFGNYNYLPLDQSHSAAVLDAQVKVVKKDGSVAVIYVLADVVDSLGRRQTIEALAAMELGQMGGGGGTSSSSGGPGLPTPGALTCGVCLGKGKVQCTAGCHGTGMQMCPSCNGAGQLWNSAKGKYENCSRCSNGKIRCSSCGGTGYKTCGSCGGTGKH